MRRLFNLDETNDDQVGVCIADIANQVVEYQNSTCARICGDQKGRTCANAGFTFCSRPFDFIKFGQGMHVSKSEQCCDGYFDLFLYNNTREKIICILPLTEILSARESEFNKFPLTPREREIVSLLLRRYS
ncbi:MAG TPA: hypothetical protein PLH57_04250, partial [Oligoflexia bacterium]|nr:hypothetical protein [Oligoflexia bacterium]